MGGRVVAGMMVLEGTSLVSKICIDVYIRRYNVYTRRYNACKVMNYTTDKMPHWCL